MTKSWKFWAVVVGVVIFIAIWLIKSMAWALAVVLMVFLGWLLAVYLTRQSPTKRRSGKKVVIIEDDNDDSGETTYIVQSKQEPEKPYIKNIPLYVAGARQDDSPPSDDRARHRTWWGNQNASFLTGKPRFKKTVSNRPAPVKPVSLFPTRPQQPRRKPQNPIGPDAQKRVLDQTRKRFWGK